jgi:hypothetical protein
LKLILKKIMLMKLAKFKNSSLILINLMLYFRMGIGDWGLGIGDWGLGIGPNPQSPIPNPQSPIPKNFKIYL